MLAFIVVLSILPAGRAGALSISAAWEYLAPDLQLNVLFPSECSSADGHVLVLARSNAGSDLAAIAVILSPGGEAKRAPFPPLPGEAGTVEQAHACRWLDDGSLLVVGQIRKGPIAAIWLTSELALREWLVLEDGKYADTHPLAIAETAPGQFVLAGVRLLQPVALRFDRRRVAPVALPWAEGPPGMLLDVIADGLGGFTVCGVEARREGGSVPTSEIVLATFDEKGAVRGEQRLSGKGCRFLAPRSGKLRVLHDDGATERLGLVLTTLDAALEPVSDETLAKPFSPLVVFPAFAMQERIFFANNFFAAERLEIRSASEQATFHLDVSAGGLIDLLPGPSRVYVVSATWGRDESGKSTPAGLRVHAVDIIESPQP